MKHLSPFSLLVKRLCTFSISSISHFKQRDSDHTTELYSRMGRTYTTKARSKELWSPDKKHRWILLARWCALAEFPSPIPGIWVCSCELASCDTWCGFPGSILNLNKDKRTHQMCSSCVFSTCRNSTKRDKRLHERLAYCWQHRQCNFSSASSLMTGVYRGQAPAVMSVAQMYQSSYISWVSELRYLGVFIARSHVFKFSLVYAKRLFHRAVNNIWKASELSIRCSHFGIRSSWMFSRAFIWTWMLSTE